MWIIICNVLFTVSAISHGISYGKKIIVAFPCVMGNRALQSTCAIHFRIKPKRKRVRKCSGGRRKIRKIKVLNTLRHQNRYSGQISKCFKIMYYYYILKIVGNYY